MVTTPTPPDAVRTVNLERVKDALENLFCFGTPENVALLASGLGMPGERDDKVLIRALFDALLTRPSDARGREALSDEALERVYDSVKPHNVRMLCEQTERDRWQVRRFADAIVAESSRAALSPTQEGANNG